MLISLIGSLLGCFLAYLIVCLLFWLACLLGLIAREARCYRIDLTSTYFRALFSFAFLALRELLNLLALISIALLGKERLRFVRSFAVLALLACTELYNGLVFVQTVLDLADLTSLRKNFYPGPLLNLAYSRFLDCLRFAFVWFI